ncbi:MAG: GTP 3',8-cyclase MoaA [Gemmatales bacterium]|nr:GTP 3',8-cyclase MoaA [Gemmatales bacterium]MDW8385518.1 GTP 3',8-cyclase MoaA [Gemmatales bacterium]
MLPRLIDGFGRVHNNLRISVTDRCNLRCTYCMPEEVTFLPRDELLTFEEIARIVRVAVKLGIDKLRLTGGEPLLRRNLDRLTAMLSAIPEIKDISLTTNGLLLSEQAKALHLAGLRRINVSLDTLRPEVFRHLTRRDGLDRILAGLESARTIGFHPIKLNAVILRGVNDEDIVPLVRFALENGFEMRFIEYMPIGAEPWERAKVFFAHEIMERIENEIGSLIPAPDYDPRSPAMEFCLADGSGRVGIIASVSRPFCHHCNRIRLTADGKLRNCLFALEEADLKSVLRNGGSDEDIAEVFRANVAAKWEGHEINTARFIKPLRTMHAIGG